MIDDDEGGPPIDEVALLRYVRRLEQIEGRIADLNAHKAEVYRRAHKGDGIEKRVLRAVVAHRRKHPVDRGAADAQVRAHLTALHRAEQREGLRGVATGAVGDPAADEARPPGS